MVDCINIGTRINDNLKNECKEKMYELCITLESAYNDERKWVEYDRIISEINIKKQDHLILINAMMKKNI